MSLDEAELCIRDWLGIAAGSPEAKMPRMQRVAFSVITQLQSVLELDSVCLWVAQRYDLLAIEGHALNGLRTTELHHHLQLK